MNIDAHHFFTQKFNLILLCCNFLFSNLSPDLSGYSLTLFEECRSSRAVLID